jgi:hypothetical protein
MLFAVLDKELPRALTKAKKLRALKTSCPAISTWGVLCTDTDGRTYEIEIETVPTTV